MIGSSTNDSNSDSFLFVITSISINNIKSFSGVEIISGKIFKDLERALSHGHIDTSPADLFLSDWIGYNSFS
jgi:hypothetical protein